MTLCRPACQPAYSRHIANCPAEEALATHSATPEQAERRQEATARASTSSTGFAGVTEMLRDSWQVRPRSPDAVAEAHTTVLVPRLDSRVNVNMICLLMAASVLRP